MTRLDTTMMTCPRCNGVGHIPAFRHVVGGVCFQCEGRKVVPYKVRTPERYSAINALHCRTLEDAQAYRLAEFERRFPALLWVLDEDTEALIAGGIGPLKRHILALEAKIVALVGT